MHTLIGDAFPEIEAPPPPPRFEFGDAESSGEGKAKVDPPGVSGSPP